jgi:polar amino acid transport system substrate-binding protein
MMHVDQETRDLLAPTGNLRVAVAVGSAISAVWTMRDAETGEPRGPTAISPGSWGIGSAYP